MGGALEARGVELNENDLVSEVVGEVEVDEKVLVIKRIHVTYHLRVDDEHHDLARRVHGFHASFCPVARTIEGCVDISTELQFAARGA